MTVELAALLAFVFGTGIGLIVGMRIGNHIASSVYKEIIRGIPDE